MSLAVARHVRAMNIAVKSVRRQARKLIVVVDMRNAEHRLDAGRHEIQEGNHAICKQN